MGLPEHRNTQRIRKRLSCELEFEERRYSGIVLDISEQGLFVQTSAKPKLGVRVHLRLRMHGVGTCELMARVARLKLVPPQLKSVANGGIGLFIEMPTPELDRFIAAANGSSAD
jgi:Tfp pilus assembly protein PilZ